MGGLIEIYNSRAAMPELLENEQTQLSPNWIVTVFDNSTNSYDEVIFILMVATGCTEDEAYIETWEIDNLGKSVVHQSSEEVCNTAAKMISTIGLRTEVSQE